MSGQRGGSRGGCSSRLGAGGQGVWPGRWVRSQHKGRRKLRVGYLVREGKGQEQSGAAVGGKSASGTGNAGSVYKGLWRHLLLFMPQPLPGIRGFPCCTNGEVTATSLGLTPIWCSSFMGPLTRLEH